MRHGNIVFYLIFFITIIFFMHVVPNVLLKKYIILIK